MPGLGACSPRKYHMFFLKTQSSLLMYSKWRNLRTVLSKEPQDGASLQLKELITKDLLIAKIPDV